jgi:secernin
MGSSMFVALGKATTAGHTFFGQNSSRPIGKGQALCLSPGRLFTPGEKLRTQHLEIPQSRQVHAVLGSRPSGLWGLTHGVNSNRVAAGCVELPAALAFVRAGLTGPDLVRLALERSSSARQGVDIVTELVKQHGQGSYPACAPEFASDSALLIADPLEAYAVEMAGGHWVYQEIKEVRAVSNVRVVHQDWDRISPGLAAHAIEQGLWPADGSKLDFSAVLAKGGRTPVASMRRWGLATILLQEQNGHIDSAFFRRLLSDHGDAGDDDLPCVDGDGGTESICQHSRRAAGSATAASFIADLSPDPTSVTHAWCAFGAPCASIYFPVFLDGELPDAFIQEQMETIGAGLGGRLAYLMTQRSDTPGRLNRAREAFARLQALFDQETEEFLNEASMFKKSGATAELQRHASMFMQYNLEKFEDVFAGALRTQARVAAVTR